MTTADESLPELLASIHHAFPAMRLRAIRAIGKLGSSARDALTALSKSLDDNDAKVREAAAQSIGQIGPDALPLLAQMLKHPDKYVRRNAVWALGKLGPLAKDVANDLCAVLRDEDPRTASGAAQTLGSMGTEAAAAIPPLAEAMRGTNIVLCRLAAKALSQIGSPALPTLITHLKHHDPFVRGEAAMSLGWMGSAAAAAVQPLIDILRTTQSSGRGIQGGSSGAHQTPATVVTPTPGDQLPEDSTRANAVQALGRIGPDAASSLPYLQDALSDSSDLVRKVAEIAVRQVQGMA